VSRIGGGVSVNAIAREAWLEVDARGTSESGLEALEREVRRIADDAAREENRRRSAGDALAYRIDPVGRRVCGHTDARSELVRAAEEATRLVSRKPELATASTDANAAMAAGIPAIAIGGGGRGGSTHSLDEWFENDRAAAGAERALTIVATAARLPDDS
jgi:tripeptide aminopeptidase